MPGLICDLDTSERPRERLLANGVGALADSELLAILLRTGGAGRSALDVARDLLRERSGLAGLVGIDPERLRRPGIGPAKSAAVLAAVELGRRLARSELPEQDLLNRPDCVARYLRLRFARQGQEILGALFLDAKNRLLGESEVFRGTLQRAAVSPRQLLKKALLADAARIVIFHTHPSGDPSPSAEDLAFTRRLAEAGEVVGLRLVDHLILGRGRRWVSLRQRGAW